MNVMTLTIESSGVYTQKGVAVDVTGIAQVLHAQNEGLGFIGDSGIYTSC